EGSLDGGEREVDVEPPARGMDASEAFGRLERPHFLEANEDKRPLPAGDDARGRTRGVRLQPGLHVHVTAPDGLRMRDPRPALTVLRCAQEIVTNAVLHARAQNLWLELSQHDGVLSLSARDDGRGASELRAGNGYSNREEVLLAIHPCSPRANGQRGPIGCGAREGSGHARGLSYALSSRSIVNRRESISSREQPELGGEASAQRACTFQVNRRLSPRREWAVANDDHFWIPADTGFVADRPRDVLH